MSLGLINKGNLEFLVSVLYYELYKCLVIAYKKQRNLINAQWEQNIQTYRGKWDSPVPHWWDSSVSSPDPSALPIIPRADTRWKRATAAGEQCFGSKRWTNCVFGVHLNVKSRTLTCKGECYWFDIFLLSAIVKKISKYTSQQREKPECRRRDALLIGEHHCFCVQCHHGPFNTELWC